MFVHLRCAPIVVRGPFWEATLPNVGSRGSHAILDGFGVADILASMNRYFKWIVLAGMMVSLNSCGLIGASMRSIGRLAKSVGNANSR